MVSLRQRDSKKCHGLRGFIGALKNGRPYVSNARKLAKSTTTAEPYTLPQLLVHWYFAVKFQLSLDRHGNAITAVWGAAVGWFSGVPGWLHQVVMVCWCVAWFLMRYLSQVSPNPYYNVVALQQWGLRW